ncbi:glycosyltransferase family 2 protein [Flavobacterium sp.]|uniref:glycosyltransferase family 2 protein n=1 Tax=Flavobacterium sp. TaxID=239 RepID=UPI00286C5577|nr:glycosyltransferase family 2 protein [Flavobacterium sp.]
MLAIVIPYYKRTFFEATLQSLTNQTDKRFKVYIGDDASPENPRELLEKYKDHFDFVYHRFEENLGGTSLVQQWERCLALSGDEEWVMILGDDDALGDNVIASWYTNYNFFKRESNLVRFATKIIQEETNTISSVYTHPIWEQNSEFFYRNFKGQTRSSLSEYVFTRKSYLKYGFKDYPLAWHSDCYAWLEFPDGKMIYTINEAIVFFRISKINISGIQDDLDLKKQLKIQFIKDVLTKKLMLFKKYQRLELLMFYEATIKKNRKLTLKEWFFLIRLYLINFGIIPFIKSIRRFLINIFNL